MNFLPTREQLAAYANEPVMEKETEGRGEHRGRVEKGS